MSHFSFARSASLVALAVIPMASWAIHGTEGVEWGAPPPVLAKGAKFAVLLGDPNQPGPYVVRLSVPAGYRVLPHWHCQAENVTVISGTVMIGMGDKWDSKALKVQKAGSFGSIPAKANHFAMFKVPTVIQIHGEGPFDLNYVDPADDPQKAHK